RQPRDKNMSRPEPSTRLDLRRETACRRCWPPARPRSHLLVVFLDEKPAARQLELIDLRIFRAGGHQAAIVLALQIAEFLGKNPHTHSPRDGVNRPEQVVIWIGKAIDGHALLGRGIAFRWLDPPDDDIGSAQ